MGKLTNPANARIKIQDRVFAANLVSGVCPTAAARAAGLTDASAKRQGYRMVNRPGVRRALAELGAKIPNEMVGQIAKGKLLQMIEDPATNAREMVQLIRAGLEVGKVIGPASEVYHKHVLEIPEAARELIAQRIVEITAKKSEIEANTIDVPQLTEG